MHHCFATVGIQGDRRAVESNQRRFLRKNGKLFDDGWMIHVNRVTLAGTLGLRKTWTEKIASSKWDRSDQEPKSRTSSACDTEQKTEIDL